MTSILMTAFAGLLFGIAWGGGAASFLIFTRSYRMANKRLMVHLGQIVVLATGVGWLLLLQLFDERIGIKRHSLPQYVAAYACFCGWIFVLFFAVRAERRWRKLVGLDSKA
ncbi:MAG TPA: hypothetical protein VMI32_08895 [Candidatus Solibacter sp.]|nr:hypothetical protein [Candidatus Solibacter sp.]